MYNSKFIKTHGFYNFLSICDKVKDDLYILKTNKKIVSYRICNKKKIIIFNTKKKLTLEFAEIYSMGYEQLIKEIGK